MIEQIYRSEIYLTSGETERTELKYLNKDQMNQFEVRRKLQYTQKLFL